MQRSVGGGGDMTPKPPFHKRRTQKSSTFEIAQRRVTGTRFRSKRGKFVAGPRSAPWRQQPLTMRWQLKHNIHLRDDHVCFYPTAHEQVATSSRRNKPNGGIIKQSLVEHKSARSLKKLYTRCWIFLNYRDSKITKRHRSLKISTNDRQK